MKTQLAKIRGWLCRRAILNCAGALLVVAAWLGTGCGTPKPAMDPAAAKADYSIALKEGDTLVIAFPGAPSLNTTQQVRRDGTIALPMAGELKVLDLTPKDIEKQVLKLYDTQLVVKEVTVTIQSAPFSVFVTGAVLKPGKLMYDRPVTVIEAIMEAGGFDAMKAKTKEVRVIRQEGSEVRTFTLNLQPVLDGQNGTSFYLKPSDTVYVPEKSQVF
jgi:polysaccharide export outer membrane protein